MATVHPAQAPLLAKQMVSGAVGFSAIWSEHCSVCDTNPLHLKNVGH